MIATNIKYKIIFHEATQKGTLPSELIASETVLPKETHLSEYTIHALKTLACNYVFNLPEQKLKEDVEATICLSSKGFKILSSTDEYIVYVADQLRASIFSPTAPIRLDASLLTGGVTVKLRLERSKDEIFAGLTTCPLRFPHLFKDLFNSCKHLENNPEAKICLMGTGLSSKIGSDKAPWCPQFIELLCLFPQAHFTLLDNDPDVVKKLTGQLITLKLGFYDPVTLMMRDFTKGKNQFLAPETYRPVLARMKENLVDMAIMPKDIDRMFAAEAETQKVVVKIPSKREASAISIQEFDVLTSSFEDEQQFDIIVSTFCIDNAILDSDTDPNEFDLLALFINCMKSLNVNGVFYIDHPSFELFSARYGFDELVHYVEVSIGHKCSIREIPLSDFLSETVSPIDKIKTPVISPNKGKWIVKTVSSCSVYAITKLPEKVEIEDIDTGRVRSKKILLNVSKPSSM